MFYKCDGFLKRSLWGLLGTNCAVTFFSIFTFGFSSQNVDTVATKYIAINIENKKIENPIKNPSTLTQLP